MDTNKVIERLKSGNQRYMQDLCDNNLPDKSLRESTAKRQQPFAVVLSCSDSRVIPEFIFNTGIGGIFVIRIAGNIANTDVIASIEYAVSRLNSKVILVLGHESCGAIVENAKKQSFGKNLDHLLSQIEEAVGSVDRGADTETLVKENTKYVAKRIEQNSEIIKSAVASGETKVLCAYYHFKSGKVEFLD